MGGDFEPSAQVIADSISPHGKRLTTLEVRFHRFVLAELNTHRAFSRNSASSRAIPVTKIFAKVADEPAIPLAWPAEGKGMQGGAPLPVLKQNAARGVWLDARDAAVQHAEVLMSLGVHKSVCNRLLEPFLPHTAIVSATDWDGFWKQRCSPLAQPELAVAANAMRDACTSSQPQLVRPGEWHLPYLDDQERASLDDWAQLAISAARCARVSYLTHDGRRSYTEDLNLYDRLIHADPPHASPLEHVAAPVARASTRPPGNFDGWYQLRHLVFGA